MRKQTIDDVLTAASGVNDQSWVDYSAVSAAEALRMRGETGVDVAGYKRLRCADEVRKIRRDHADDARPITDEDFRALRHILQNPAGIVESRRAGKLDALVSTVHTDARMIGRRNPHRPSQTRDQVDLQTVKKCQPTHTQRALSSFAQTAGPIWVELTKLRCFGG